MALVVLEMVQNVQKCAWHWTVWRGCRVWTVMEANADCHGNQKSAAAAQCVASDYTCTRWQMMLVDCLAVIHSLVHTPASHRHATRAGWQRIATNQSLERWDGKTFPRVRCFVTLHAAPGITAARITCSSYNVAVQDFVLRQITM